MKPVGTVGLASGCALLEAHISSPSSFFCSLLLSSCSFAFFVFCVLLLCCDCFLGPLWGLLCLFLPLPTAMYTCMHACVQLVYMYVQKYQWCIPTPPPPIFSLHWAQQKGIKKTTLHWTQRRQNKIRKKRLQKAQLKILQWAQHKKK